MEKQNQQNLFKEVMGNYPTGVTIVTTCDEDGNPVGLTVNSFASVSLDPLLILWSIDHRVSSLNAFKMADGFVVHVLAGDQQKLCQLFASRNSDRFSSCNWSLSSQNLPILENTFAVLECKKYKQVEAGDHTILIGEVTNITVHEKEPMLYHRRHFGPIPAEFHSVLNK
ncbi:flavin reductase family protein [Neobacillus drentensis]|uniref:flavin reductase family protein n=1 Tax=Neobacillus drentensis TaxID=220684 RepID=UPI00082482DD|nr:flavin reductase family protein [Neobacillus drentensis]